MLHLLSLLFVSNVFAQFNSPATQMDEYTRRIQIVRERDSQTIVEKLVAGRLLAVRTFHRLITGFIETHNGLKSEGQCYVKGEVCSADDGCRNSGPPANVGIDQLPGQTFFVQVCSVNLNDGLACQVTNTVNGDRVDWNSIEAKCVDTQSHPVTLRYPNGARHQKGRKAVR